MNNTIRLIYSVFFYFLLVMNATAHEEPVKTIKEKKDAEKKRQQIISNKISKTTIWKIHLINNTISEEKHKYAEILYDKNGCKTQITLFDENERIDFISKMVYDFENRMILDYDISKTSNIGEKTLFQYNTKGFIEKVIDINPEDRVSSVGLYTYIEKAKKIVYTKYITPSKVEYTLHYLYDTDIHSGNCIEIEKKDSLGNLVMKVVNTFDKKGIRTSKEIYNAQKKLEYKFVYTYNDNNDFLTITKISDTGEIMNTDQYFYNEKGLLIKIVSSDKDGKFTNIMTYTYE